MQTALRRRTCVCVCARVFWVILHEITNAIGLLLCTKKSRRSPVTATRWLIGFSLHDKHASAHQSDDTKTSSYAHRWLYTTSCRNGPWHFMVEHCHFTNFWNNIAYIKTWWNVWKRSYIWPPSANTGVHMLFYNAGTIWRRVGRGSIFFDPTRPNPQTNRPNPTRPIK